MSEPIDLSLKEFGYVYGDYLCTCRDCEEQFDGDKRAWRCEICARKVSKVPVYEFTEYRKIRRTARIRAKTAHEARALFTRDHILFDGDCVDMGALDRAGYRQVTE